MIRDEAIEQIRERRRRLIKERYGGSIDRYFDEAMEWQKKNPGRVARPLYVKEPRKKFE
jgi:hypothetical protein